MKPNSFAAIVTLLSASAFAAGCLANENAAAEQAAAAEAALGVQGTPQNTAPSQPCAGEDADTARVRASLDRVRALAGLAPMRCDAHVAAAAEAHCQYVAANQQLTHVEIVGHPFFSGVNVGDRLASQHFGGENGGEVLTNLTGTAAIDDPRGLVNSVYHRALFLRAETTSFGYGHDVDCTTVDFGRTSGAPAQRVIWPPDGATNVPPSFRADKEAPSPLPGAGKIGSPISYFGLTPDRVRSARLTDATGGVVPSFLLVAGNDPAGLVRKPEAHLLPLAPLAERSVYRARFVVGDGEGDDDSESSTFTVTFTTGSEP